MRLDDNAVGMDSDEIDGEASEAFGLGAETELEPGAESDARVDAVGHNALEEPGAQSDSCLDEALLEAELGDCDAFVFDDEEDLDEEILAAEAAEDDEDDEDDLEMMLLQELGIDLDAPDDVAIPLDLAMTFAVTGGGDDDVNDDEIAA